MAVELQPQKARLRVDKVAGHATELLELHSVKPLMHIVLVPGNPGIVTFYCAYVESLFKFLDGKASITALCHIAHTSEDWEFGKLYGLEDQIEHKVQFLKGLIEMAQVPIVLVGHSIGAYIALELLKKFPDKVHLVLGIYPFLTLNRESMKQFFISKICLFHPLSEGVSILASLLGSFPKWLSRAIVKIILGRAWGATSVDVACSYLLKYAVVRNFIYMGETEFHKLKSPPDWELLRKNEAKIFLLFGSDDHWGPLSHFKEISKEVPSLRTFVEREGLLHDFCCNEVGSIWVAGFTADVVLSTMKDYE